MFSRRNDSNIPASQTDPEATGDVVPLVAAPSSESIDPAPRAASPTIQTPYAGESVISPDLTIEGNVQSKGSIRLEGTIQGELHCNSVVVERTGNVTGGIQADDVSVHGKVAGTIRGKSVMLYSTAHVEGDVFHQGIGIEMGTHYDGRLKWSDGGVTEQTSRATTQAISPASSTSAKAAPTFVQSGGRPAE